MDGWGAESGGGTLRPAERDRRGVRHKREVEFGEAGRLPGRGGSGRGLPAAEEGAGWAVDVVPTEAGPSEGSVGESRDGEHGVLGLVVVGAFAAHVVRDALAGWPCDEVVVFAGPGE
jgi:hypothetical protein